MVKSTIFSDPKEFVPSGTDTLEAIGAVREVLGDLAVRVKNVGDRLPKGRAEEIYDAAECLGDMEKKVRSAALNLTRSNTQNNPTGIKGL